MYFRVSRQRRPARPRIETLIYAPHSPKLSSGLTAKAAGIHPVPSRTRKLSPPTFPAVLQCASLREACPPSRRAGAGDLGTLVAYPCGRRRTVPLQRPPMPGTPSATVPLLLLPAAEPPDPDEEDDRGDRDEDGLEFGDRDCEPRVPCRGDVVEHHGHEAARGGVADPEPHDLVRP